MRIALILEYEGTDFHGSQLQASERTVQGELERALHTLFGQETRCHLASRTDAGVHATGQVAAFDVETTLADETIRKALNYYLPEDLRVRAAARVPERFDPRRNAQAREYVYTLSDAEVPSALHRRTEVPVWEPLDEAAVERAGRAFEGVHDFASFAGPATRKGAVTVRRVDRVSVERRDHRVTLTFCGNAFLHQQVRRMTAALVDVGQGRSTEELLNARLEAAERNTPSRIMPARGLCLVGVKYPDAGPSGLPAPDGN